jgi:hypothetical protein
LTPLSPARGSSSATARSRRSIISVVPRISQLTPLGLPDPARALALGNSPPHLWLSLLASLLWIGAALVGSWLSFRNQEFGS